MVSTLKGDSVFLKTWVILLYFWPLLCYCTHQSCSKRSANTVTNQVQDIYHLHDISLSTACFQVANIHVRLWGWSWMRLLKNRTPVESGRGPVLTFSGTIGFRQNNAGPSRTLWHILFVLMHSLTCLFPFFFKCILKSLTIPSSMVIRHRHACTWVDVLEMVCNALFELCMSALWTCVSFKSLQLCMCKRETTETINRLHGCTVSVCNYTHEWVGACSSLGVYKSPCGGAGRGKRRGFGDWFGKRKRDIVLHVCNTLNTIQFIQVDSHASKKHTQKA